MGVLAQVLRDQPGSHDPNLIVGTDTFDDAGVYRLNDSTALVLTLDFFPPLVDDPYEFGRIAAANSLSDVYAMGGKPITVLNIVGFPDKELPAEILGEILRGGAERVSAAGAIVAGGHSVRDAEIKYGLSVTGIVHPDRILTNRGAKVGDVLVLTKPIGGAQLTTAAKKGVILQTDLAQAIDVMTDLNAGACAAALEVGVHAATDITGFGLIGHAFEMADASDVTIEIDANTVPLMDHALKLARDGVVTRACQSNLEHVSRSVTGDETRIHPYQGGTQGGSSSCTGLDVRGVEEALVKVLADAQTSGGLLLSVAPDRVDALLVSLKRRQTRSAAIIGRVTSPSTHRIVLS